MKARAVVNVLVSACLTIAPIAGAQACGELRFNAGRGLPFQTYVAPRAADVLIVRSDATDEEYIAALERAGHRVTTVESADAVANEVRNRHYDVVIAAYESVDRVGPAVTAADAGPQLLPIVTRAMRNSPQVTERFEQILLDSASFGQYLSMINKVLSRLP
jgi:DNA-binding NtrC family response regulator